MATFKKGDTVRQIVPIIEGTVAGFQIDQETGARLILVEWQDGEGVTQRYFDENQLFLVGGTESATIKPVAEESAASLA